MKAEQKYVRDKAVPEEKLKLVKDLADKFKKSKTVLIASMRGLPGGQFNEIKKKFRGKAEVVFAKKSILFRAIDKSEKGMLQEFKKQISSDFVLFFSEFDAFELSGMLSDSLSPAKAKAGDTAPEDIEIEPGLTELIPGPAISELSGVGLKVAVKEGKLDIIKGAVVVKEGAVISDKVAGVLGKLGIEPMRVGFIPIAAYDAKEDKVYIGIKIDKAGTLEELKDMIKKALGFAINIEYTTDKTISYFIAKAAMEEKALARKIGSGEDKKEEKKEEKKPAEEAAAEETVAAPAENAESTGGQNE